MRGRAEATGGRIVDAAYGVFYKEGFAHAGLEAVARAAGVTKRTLYHHFDSKQALIAAVLEVQHGLALTRIREWGERGAGDPSGLAETIGPRPDPGSELLGPAPRFRRRGPFRRRPVRQRAWGGGRGSGGPVRSGARVGSG